MIILDTNVVSELLRVAPDVRVVAWIESLCDDVAITAITAGELLAGIRVMPESRRRDELASAVSAVIDDYRGTRAILSFDDAAAEEYASVLARRRGVGRPISTADACIAAICRAHGATCATRNVRDFDETGVDVVNPWEWKPA